MNKNVFMRKIIDNLIIKTQIFKIMHEKSDKKKKKTYQKIAIKYF